jgi:hypothetical protein
MGKCAPGVICIENITMLYIFILASILLIVVYYHSFSNSFSKNKMMGSMNTNYMNYNNHNNHNNNENDSIFPRANYGYSNVKNDILLNPYEGPSRDTRLFPNLNINSLKMPINIETQSVDTNYRQVGILTRVDNTKEMILPLMGRPLITHRDKWNFYTIGENNMIKIPIHHKGVNCTSSLGCNDLYSGDIIKIDGYNSEFKVTLYENNTLKYIPYI